MPTLDWLHREAVFQTAARVPTRVLRPHAAGHVFGQPFGDPAHAFHFDPACYPVSANKRYRGKFRFTKHFYPVLSDLEDGGEEWRCALAIDEHPRVRRWVRNLDSDPVAGFWLPTSGGRFYPDFVCELSDGRLLVAEYKGDHLRHLPREIEKDQVGRVWAANSNGRAVFAMLFKHDQGMGLTEQIDKALGG